MGPLPEDCLGEGTVHVVKQTKGINHFRWDLETPGPGLSSKEDTEVQS